MIVSNEEKEDIMKSVKYLEEFGLLIKGAKKKQLKMNQKKQRGGFHGMLLGTLGASLLQNMLAGKGLIGAGERTIRVGQAFWFHLILK